MKHLDFHTAGASAMFEQLEPRLLLDGTHESQAIQQFNASPALFVGEKAGMPVGPAPSETAFNYFVGDKSNSRSTVPANEDYTDADGDLVTVCLKGPGSLELVRPAGDADATEILLEGTTTASSLTISVKKPKLGGGTGRTQVGDVHVNGSLRSLSAKTTNLMGDLTVTGNLGTLTFGDVMANHQILVHTDSAISVDPKLKLSMTFGRVADCSVNTNGVSIGSLTAIEWLNTDGTADKIEAPSVGPVKTKGDSKTWQGGDFQADITATAGSIGAMTLSGGSLTSTLSAPNGQVGKLTVTALSCYNKDTQSGGLLGGNINVTVDAGAVRAKSLGGLSAKGGSITASISATGDVAGISASGMRYKSGVDYDDEDEHEYAVYTYATGDVTVNIVLPDEATTAAISATGGNCSATIEAGDAGAITAKGVLSDRECYGGNVTVALTIARTAGALSATGGSVLGTLRAGNSIGSITGKAMTLNAAGHWLVYPGEEGEPGWREWETTASGACWGGAIDVTIYQGTVGALDPQAKLGAITGTGMNVTVHGQVACPLEGVLSKITSKTMTYTSDFETDYDDNDNEIIIPVVETIGGYVDAAGLAQV